MFQNFFNLERPILIKRTLLGLFLVLIIVLALFAYQASRPTVLEESRVQRESSDANRMTLEEIRALLSETSSSDEKTAMRPEEIEEELKKLSEGETTTSKAEVFDKLSDLETSR